jgi:hypothetical protein
MTRTIQLIDVLNYFINKKAFYTLKQAKNTFFINKINYLTYKYVELLRKKTSKYLHQFWNP